MDSKPISIFFSYSRKDKGLMQDLLGHLEPLRRRRLIDSWHDGCISPGEEWEPKIKENLEKAQIILLLASVDFINSDYCYTVELGRAIARHQAGNACVIPVILRPCAWDEVPVGDMLLGDLQVLPEDAVPISEWRGRDAACTNVVKGLSKKIRQLHTEREQAAYAAKLAHYRQAFADAVQASYPLSQAVLKELGALEQQLGLQAEDIRWVEHPIREPAESKYQKVLAEAKRQQYYNTGCDHLDQDNYDQAIADFIQAKQLCHPQAVKLLAEAEQRQREEVWRQRKRDECYSTGCDHLDQGNYNEAIANFTQAEQLGHPQAAEQLAEAERQREQVRDECYNSGCDRLNQGDYDEAIANFTQAEQLGHPQAAELLTTAQRKREEVELQCKRDKAFEDVVYHLFQSNYDQAIANYTLAEQLGHPQAAKLLDSAKMQCEEVGRQRKE